MTAAVAQPARFLIVGVGGYVVNLGVFAALHGAGMSYVLASVLSYFISNALMYLGNRYFTFQLRHEGFWRAYLSYMVAGVIVVGLVVAVLAFLVEYVGLDPRLGQAIALLVVTPVAFALFKRWTFQLR